MADWGTASTPHSGACRARPPARWRAMRGICMRSAIWICTPTSSRSHRMPAWMRFCHGRRCRLRRIGPRGLASAASALPRNCRGVRIRNHLGASARFWLVAPASVSALPLTRRRGRPLRWRPHLVLLCRSARSPPAWLPPLLLRPHHSSPAMGPTPHRSRSTWSSDPDPTEMRTTQSSPESLEPGGCKWPLATASTPKCFLRDHAACPDTPMFNIKISGLANCPQYQNGQNDIIVFGLPGLLFQLARAFWGARAVP